mgnify:FL=1
MGRFSEKGLGIVVVDVNDDEDDGSPVVVDGATDPLSS